MPGCAVATVEFEAAAAAQASAIGFDPALLFVPHPVQNRTAAELAAVADATVPRLLALFRLGDEEALTTVPEATAAEEGDG